MRFVRFVVATVFLLSALFIACSKKPADEASSQAVSLQKSGASVANPKVLDGGIEVLAIADVGGREMDIELFEGGPLTDEQRLAVMPGGKAPSSVNVFLVKTGGRSYLVDAGFGNAVKDGRIDPSKVDGVLITHAHQDHIAGLLKEDGSANFEAPVFFSKPESDYWLDPASERSELMKKIAVAYEGRYRTFSFGDTLAPGIVAVDASGHTPGHTAFLAGLGKEKVLIAGDFLHAAALQFPHPEECAKFDMDRVKSVEMRKNLIQMSIDNNWYIAGIHIPMPGMSHVAKRDGGGYQLVHLVGEK
jgi:glyoxylase-like metal-dependent hydrolase (beta-lactamase superfamily II)